MGVLELRDVTLELGGQRILNDLTVDFWEGHVHALDRAERRRQVDAGRHHHGPARLPAHAGRDPARRRAASSDLPVDERARRGITLAWQEPARFEGLRVDRFILAGAKDKSARRRCARVLEPVGLDPEKYAARAVDKTLSGGERKRIELASHPRHGAARRAHGRAGLGHRRRGAHAHLRCPRRLQGDAAPP